MRVVIATVGLFSSVACGAIACDTPHRTRSPYAAPTAVRPTSAFRGGVDWHGDRPRPEAAKSAPAAHRPAHVDDDQF